MSRSGDIDGRYLVTERRPKSEFTLVPDPSANAIREPLPHLTGWLRERYGSPSETHQPRSR